MGGKSSSSNSTTDNSQNNSSQVGVSGDNDGIILSGIQDSSVVLTDHGATAAAANVANNAVSVSGDMLENALKFSSGTVSEAFDFGESSMSEAFNFSENTVNEALGFGESALDSITEAMNQSSSIAGQSMQFANAVNASSATGGASDLAQQNNKSCLSQL